MASSGEEMPVTADSNAVVDAAKKPNAGNGGDTEKYTWHQTLSDVTITVPFTPGTRGRDCMCETSAMHIKFGLKRSAAIVDADLPRRVIKCETTWLFEVESGLMTIVLQKEGDSQWWKSIAVGEPEIDSSKIEPESSKLSDLDGETRGVVSKLMFDQRQQAMGFPTSGDIEKERFLASFMAQHPEMEFGNTVLN